MVSQSATPSRPKPIKRFGQHFLASPAIAQRIVDAARITKNDTVLEIGPGRGILTDLIVEMAGNLVAVELDRHLARELALRYHSHSNVRVIQGDFLEIDWLCLGPFGERDNLVVANLPYNVSVPILEKLLGRAGFFKRMVVMVQKEVAARMASGPNSKDYGSLSVFIQTKASVRRLFDVRPGSFVPPPQVMSTVVELTPLAVPLVPENEGEEFYNFVRACFSYRRKTLGAGLRHLLGQEMATIDGETLSDVDLKRRAEELSVGEFVSLYQNLAKSLDIK